VPPKILPSVPIIIIILYFNNTLINEGLGYDHMILYLKQ
jgi:hypothetical protein